LILLYVIVAVFIFVEPNNEENNETQIADEELNENIDNEELINIYNEMLKIIEKNNAHYSKNLYKKTYKSKTISKPIPIPISQYK